MYGCAARKKAVLFKRETATNRAFWSVLFIYFRSTPVIYGIPTRGSPVGRTGAVQRRHAYVTVVVIVFYSSIGTKNNSGITAGLAKTLSYTLSDCTVAPKFGRYKKRKHLT